MGWGRRSQPGCSMTTADTTGGCLFLSQNQTLGPSLEARVRLRRAGSLQRPAARPWRRRAARLVGQGQHPQPLPGDSSPRPGSSCSPSSRCLLQVLLSWLAGSVMPQCRPRVQIPCGPCDLLGRRRDRPSPAARGRGNSGRFGSRAAGCPAALVRPHRGVRPPPPAWGLASLRLEHLQGRGYLLQGVTILVVVKPFVKIHVVELPAVRLEPVPLVLSPHLALPRPCCGRGGRGAEPPPWLVTAGTS